MVDQVALARFMNGAFTDYQETGGQATPTLVTTHDPTAVVLEIPAILPVFICSVAVPAHWPRPFLS